MGFSLRVTQRRVRSADGGGRRRRDDVGVVGYVANKVLSDSVARSPAGLSVICASRISYRAYADHDMKTEHRLVGGRLVGVVWGSKIEGWRSCEAVPLIRTEYVDETDCRSFCQIITRKE